MTTFLETGQGARWRGRRWRVLEEERAGFVTLVGIEPANRDQVVTPLIEIEAADIVPDVLPLPELDVEHTDRARWRALHQAYLTTMAGGREQLVGIDWGAVAVEPYQLVPLLRVARTIRPRLLIADDTGLGKTAEAGIILRWLAQRHQANRVLVVTRAAPEPQRWQQELWTKFGFRFDILPSGADFNERRRRTPSVNVFAQQPRLIVSMTLAARQALLDELRQCPVLFDVIIVDEAHHLAERGSSTKRLAVLGRRALAPLCKDGTLLLLTATPHDGKTESFLSLLRLLDPFVETEPGKVPLDVASRLLVRRLKSEVTLAGGRKFQKRRIRVISTLGDATRQEKALDKSLDAYLAWLADEEARYEGAGARQKAKGCQFLAGVLKKRFGSSVAALRATLRRRLGDLPDPEDADEVADLTEDPYASDPEDELIDPGVGSETPPPALAVRERELARALLEAAELVPREKDSKLQAMSRLLRDELTGEKVVIFTEYRDTLRAAARRLTADGVSFVTFHGATADGERNRAIAAINRDPDVRVFLATDAASEGKNLQRAAHHLIHLDVPWNPNRYEQRNGRIDRYGQAREPNVWALVAADRKKHQGRPESRALELVIEKLRKISDEVGSASKVLPGYMSGSVRDVLTSADPDAESRLDEMLDDPDLRGAEEDLTRLSFRNRRDIDEAEAYVARLGTTDDFESELRGLLEAAFRGWDDGGNIEPVEDGIVRVAIPSRLRPSMRRFTVERATFRRDLALAEQDDEAARAAEFLTPGHPLVEATLRALREEASDPNFHHRFDVEADSAAGLVLSFAMRFVDGEGRTVEERLDAVEVPEDGIPLTDARAALERLGLQTRSSTARPDPAAIAAWRARFRRAVDDGRVEAERRAESRIQELKRLAQALRDEELEILGRWRAQQEVHVELLTLGTGQLTLTAGEAYDQQMKALGAEYEARREAVRDRSDIRLVALELIGGRLYVQGSQ